MRDFSKNGGQLVTWRVRLWADKTSGHVSDSARALEGIAHEEGTTCLCHKQAPPAAAQMCSLCSLAAYKPLLVVGRKGSRRGLLPLLLIHPSEMQAHTVAKDPVIACRLHRVTHIRQTSAFSSCSLYAVTSLLTCPNLPASAALSRPFCHMVLVFTCCPCKQDTPCSHRMAVTLI